MLLQDCMALVEECVVSRDVNSKDLGEKMCRRLSPEGAPCMSLGYFSHPSVERTAADVELSTPCRGHPCNDSEVCTVNRDCPKGKSCPQFTCDKGRG
jgi:hypothetical protein